MKILAADEHNQRYISRMMRHEIVPKRIYGFNIERTMENTEKHIVFVMPQS